VRRLAQVAILSALLALVPASAAWASYRIGISKGKVHRIAALSRGIVVRRAHSRPPAGHSLGNDVADPVAGPSLSLALALIPTSPPPQSRCHAAIVSRSSR
jgi:hypothetical protein